MVKPIPDEYPRVMPYLIVDGAAAAIDFYGSVFGATERGRMPAPGGKIGHAELEIGDSMIMLADESPEMDAVGPRSVGGTPVSLLVYVEDVDSCLRPCRPGRRQAAGGGGRQVLRRSLRPVRGSVRAPVECRHARRGCATG